MGQKVDAVIIGAGVIGTATAFELCKRGYKTLNIDKLPSAPTQPSVARLVYLLTGTMGVLRACLLSFEARSCHPRGPDLAGKLLPCPTHLTGARAPTGGRQAILASRVTLAVTQKRKGWKHAHTKCESHRSL